MNRNNLLKLAAKLESLPANYGHFNMMFFGLHGETEEELEPFQIKEAFEHSCGTVACAIGHAPTIPGLEALPDDDWEIYSERVFGLHYWGDDRWEFVFGFGWSTHDDPRHHTAHAAAKRLRLLAELGCAPDDWDAYIDA